MGKTLTGHVRIEVAHPTCMQLNGFDAGGFMYLHGIDIAIYIRLHNSYTKVGLQTIDELYQRRCLSATRGRHQVKEKHSFRFEFSAQFICIGIIVSKDAAFYLDDFHRIRHNKGGYLLRDTPSYGYYCNNSSIIVQAALATGLPGPKIAATPAL